MNDDDIDSSVTPLHEIDPDMFKGDRSNFVPFPDECLEGLLAYKEALDSQAAYEEAMHAMDTEWQRKLWMLRRELPERRPVRAAHLLGGVTALEEALPLWIEALRGELTLARRLRRELRREGRQWATRRR